MLGNPQPDIRELALRCLGSFGETAPKQLGNALPEVVPEITACMWDTKKQIKKASTDAMREALKVIGNKDIEHMTEKILTAITKPKEVPEIMHEMAGVTFVQSVESPALAMVVPLLLRGLREKATATKRQSAVIINNMSKLVDNPIDAAPFLPLLLPALETNAGSIADPEARGVTEKAVEQMKRLDDLAKKAVSIRGDVSKLSAELKKAFRCNDATGGLEMCVDHASAISTCMMDLGFLEDVQWKKNLSPTFASYYDAAKSEAAIKAARIEAARIEAEKMMEIPEENDDDDDAEELCNCQFTLAYGTKILLHNAKMKLLRGKKYGLLGGNDSRKTTLMRSIAKDNNIPKAVTFMGSKLLFCLLYFVVVSSRCGIALAYVNCGMSSTKLYSRRSGGGVSCSATQYSDYGLLRKIDYKSDDCYCYSQDLKMDSINDIAWLMNQGLAWEAAKEDAKDGRFNSTEAYLKNISEAFAEFELSKEVHDREDFYGFWECGMMDLINGLLGRQDNYN